MVRHYRGSILIITLWLVTILATLTVATARYLSFEVHLTKYRMAREQAKVLARSGVYLAMQRLATDAQEESYDWLQDDWAIFPQEDPDTDLSVWKVLMYPKENTARETSASIGYVEIRITDEDRNLDINKASLNEITYLIGSADAASAIVDYYDSDTDGQWETSVEDPPYIPKNAPVTVLEELLAVPGVASLFSLLEQSTVAIPPTNTPMAVNINTANAKVLGAIGMPSLADDIIQFRKQGHYFTDLNPPTAEDPTVVVPFDTSDTEFLNTQNRLSVVSRVFRVETTGRIQNQTVNARVKAVVDRALIGKATQALPKVLSWQEG